jgi:hypothetical protein
MTALNQYFTGTANKYLSAVDATTSSNQHEIGSNRFTEILGNPGSEKLYFKTTFLFFAEDDELPEVAEDIVTYYDTRLKQPNRSAEYRLYYRDNTVTALMQEGDFFLVAKRCTGELLIAIARPGSNHERRLRFLFNISDTRQKWIIEGNVSTVDLNIASRSILEAIGIEINDVADDYLDKLVEKFGLKFPKTMEFSAFARETLGQHVNPRLHPDTALEEWMKQEERLFRTLERNIVQIRLDQGFTTVESFIEFSLSVQNRRKSRVGHALENHLEAIFKANDVRYQRGAKTEGNAKPDFLFPSAKEYHDMNIGSPPLRMLAAKSTCKDRWRQILVEAAKISDKHLFTLETAISETQTTEMENHSVQLVVPTSVAQTFSTQQQKKLISLAQFVELLPL